MTVRRQSPFLVGIAMLFALGAFAGRANAQGSCTTGSGTVTCTGGAGAAVNDTNNLNTYPPNTIAAQTGFGTTINVTGGGSAVQTVSVTLNGYTSEYNVSGNNNYYASVEMGLMLVSPTGQNMELLRCPGGLYAQSNMTVTLKDGGTTIPNCEGGSGSAWTASGTYAPGSYNDGTENEPNYAQAGAPALLHSPATNGSSTLAGVFTGADVNGDWKLYLVSDAYAETNVSFTSWSITITYTAASINTTTSLSSSATSAFTSGANSSVTLTASVTSGATGTVTFQNGGTDISCSAGNPVPLSSGQAQCTTTFTSEGLQSLTATYGGNSTYVGSFGTAAVFTYNHATSTGTTYCNPGTISSPGSVDVLPYPSVIYVGDGTSGSPSISSDSVDTVSVALKSFSSNDANGLHMLLVSPDGNHALEFWGDAGGGAASSGTYTLQDGSPEVPNSALSPGTYGPTTNYNYLVFTLGTPIGYPAPQPPSGSTSFSLAAPAGSATFESSFVGATANGQWLLFVDSEASQTITTTTANVTGWCIDISPASGAGTTVSLSSNPTTYATKGSQVKFTATVTSSGTVNEGTVTFSENDVTLGTGPVSSGTATYTTSSLPEGDNTVTATYTDGSGNYNTNTASETLRVDAATSTPVLNGSTWTYCNPAGITIPAGSVFTNDIGPAAPNPSNIFVTNLPGVINTVTLTLNSFSLEFPADLESLLVGPQPVGVSVPGTAQTLDFFSLTGGTNGTNFDQTVTFADAYAPVPAAGPVGAQVAATSRGVTSYTASPFYTLPSTFQYAAPQGNFDFDNSVHGVYADANPNGTWSLYFDQITHYTGTQGATSWCVNFVETPPSVTVTESHLGSSPSNQFAQGQQGAQLTTAIVNNGPGSTGDPLANNPLTVTDTLNSAFTYASYSGSGWTCNTTALPTLTCTNDSAVAQGSSYPTLTINVNISTTATSPISNQVSVSGDGVSSTSGSDSITIYPAPLLSVSKSHTGNFTQGQTAVWSITVNNTAANSDTGGTTNLSDPLPTGYTVASFTGTGWSCPGAVGTGTLTCTSSQVVGGGASFNTLQVTVNVPANSATSVSNTASAWGGGDLTHTSSGTAASSNIDTATVAQVPASISINGSATQSTTISTAFGSLAVTVKDAAGVAIPTYSSVVFTATTGTGGQSGTFSNSTGTISISTNGSGVANPGTFTANGKAGAYTVGVTAGSATATFNLTNNVGTPNTIVATSGGGQSANTNAQFTNPLVATVSDSGGNLLSGVTVTFTPPAQTGASITFAGNVNTATTNGSGVATSAVITANGNAGGPYSVGASAGSASTSFSLTNSQQQYQLTTQVSPAGAGTISPSSELVGGGTVVPVSATANAGYVFTGFSGALTGATNPQNLTVNGPSTVTANFSAYINVTSSVSVSSGGFTYNKVSKQGTATFTIKNTSSQTISGPVELVLSGLPAGVTAANNAGTFGGNPYWTVTTTASIAPGASAQVSVTLAYPSGTTITYTDSVYSGTL